MSENLHDIDDLFRDPIEAHEEMPSARVWDDIDHRLDKKNIVRTKKKYNNLKLFSAALLLLLMSVIVYQLLSNHQHKEPASKAMDNAHTETVQATPAATLPGSNHSEKPTRLRENAIANETTLTKDLPADVVATKPKPDASGTPGAVDKTAAAGPAATTTTSADIRKSNEVTANTKTGYIINKDPSKTTADEPGENNTGRGAATAAVNGGHNSETAVLNKTLKIKNRISAGTGQRFTKTNKLTAGKTGYKAATENIVDQEGKQVLVKDRFKQLKLQQYAGAGKLAADRQAAGNNSIAAHNQDTAAANKKIELPVQMKRPLEGIWIGKSMQEETVVLPIHVSIAGNDGLPAWVREKTAMKPVLIKKTSPLHFSVMPFYSPQFSFNRIEADEDHRRQFPQGPSDREKIKNDETYSSSSAWGILVALPLGKQWGLQSGLSYNTRSVSIQPKKVYAQLANDGKVKYRFDCSSGYTFLPPKAGSAPVVGDSITVASSSNNLQYIGIPLTLDYTFFSTKKFNVVPQLGLMANFLVKQSIEASLDAGTSQKQNFTSIEGLRKTYFNGMAGLGLQYNISKRLSLNLVPAVNFALSSINQQAAVKSYLNSFSITGGVKIQF